MSQPIEFQVLRYLSFQPRPAEGEPSLWEADSNEWKQALTFVDTAGLTLVLRANLKHRGDFEKLPWPAQQELEQRFQDNLARTSEIGQELIQFNQLLQDRNIRFLNLKGQILYPDFAERREDRLQYDHDFLICTEDLERARTLFLDLGYTELPASPRLAVGHLPTLIKKTGWDWRGNLFDPAIPRAVELHFELWDADFDRIPIQALDGVWLNSTVSSFQSLPLPVPSREHILLHCALHAFRHLLRNDLRLSHLYEIGYFLQVQRESEDFWLRFLKQIALCPNSCRAVATIFELSRWIFCAQPNALVGSFISRHLPSAAALWIQRYGWRESKFCYRRSKSAVFLHLGFVQGIRAKAVVTARKLVPRHRPPSSFGVQVPDQRRDRKFTRHQLLHDWRQLARRTLFHIVTLTTFLFEFPLWKIRLHFQKRRGRIESSESLSSVRPSFKA